MQNSPKTTVVRATAAGGGAAASAQEHRELVSREGWDVSISKLCILRSDAAESWSKELQMPLPEMTFGDNSIEITNKSKNVSFRFNAREGLEKVEKKPSIEVSHAKQWKDRSLHGGHVPVFEYDWTFSTSYHGSLWRTNDKSEETSSSSSSSFVKVDGEDWQEKTEEKIDFERLKPHSDDEMVLFEEIPLFEDELHDNGTSTLSIRIRVTGKYVYILLRQWLRVDGVLFRSFEVRRAIFFNENYSLSQRTVRQSDWGTIVTKLRSSHPESRAEDLVTDADTIVPMLEIKSDENYKFVY